MGFRALAAGRLHPRNYLRALNRSRYARRDPAVAGNIYFQRQSAAEDGIAISRVAFGR